MKDGCPFCDYEGPSPVLSEGTILMVPDFAFPYYVIEPLHPVTPGHLLVIPRAHVEDFRSHPRLLGAMMQAAADVPGLLTLHGFDTPGCNLIVSAGVEATQTVMHLHVHVVPRREGDGLLLPWSNQRAETPPAFDPTGEPIRAWAIERLRTQQPSSLHR